MLRELLEAAVLSLAIKLQAQSSVKNMSIILMLGISEQIEELETEAQHRSELLFTSKKMKSFS